MNKTPGLGLLVTLLCPNPKCRKRVAVMATFPRETRTIKPGEITLIDGRTAPDPYRLVCKACFTVFPAYTAGIPQYLVDAARGELLKEQDRLLAETPAD